MYSPLICSTGHWKLSHVVKNIVLAQVNLLFVFVIFAVLYRSSTLYEAFGFPKNSSMPVLIGLIIILQFILQIYNTVSFRVKYFTVLES